MATQPTINTIWAEGTSNKSKFTESDINVGIAYKGAVVSNQLNGIANSLYDMLDFVQRSGGYYNASKTYNKNDVVSIVRQTESTPLQIEYYMCKVNDIFALPPIKGAEVDDTFALNIYTGGVLDSINWQRVSGNDASLILSRSDDDNPFTTNKKIQFLIPTDFNSLEYNQQIAGGTLKFSVYLNNDVTTFDVNVKQRFVRNLDNSIRAFNNHFDLPVPELEISNVQSSVRDFGEVNNYHDLMPYGIRFEVGSIVKQEGGDAYFIFIQCREEVKKIVVEGYCSGFNVSLGDEFIDTLVTTHLIIPIKENGGALSYERLGSMIDFDFEPSAEQAYKKGLYVLNNEEAVTLNTDLFSMLFKEQGSMTIPAMLGRFRRNQGKIRDYAQSLSFRENQESGLPNIVGNFDATSANLSGAFSSTGVASPSYFSSGSFRFTKLFFNASKNDSIYQDNHKEVTPDNFCVRMCYIAF